MQAIAFKGTVGPGGQIELPPEVVSAIPDGEPLRVVVMREASSAADAAWQETGRRQFEAAYSADDAIYEQLINERPRD